MNSKPLTRKNETEEREMRERVRNMEYLTKCFHDLKKIDEEVKLDEPLSVSYADGKRCAWLKNIISFMIKNDFVDNFLHEILTRRIEFIEGEVDFFNKAAREASKKGEEVLSALIRREIYVNTRNIDHYIVLLISLFQIVIEEWKTEAKEKMALQKQGEKLAEMLAKQVKERREKMSQYIK